MSLFIFFIIIILLAVNLAITSWVYEDALKNGASRERARYFAIMVFGYPVFGLLSYLSSDLKDKNNS